MEWKKYEDILFKDVICKHDSGEISEALGLTAEEYKRLNEAVAEFMGELDKNGKMSVFAEEFMKAPKMLQVGSLIILKQIANDFEISDWIKQVAQNVAHVNDIERS